MPSFNAKYVETDDLKRIQNFHAVTLMLGVPHSANAGLQLDGEDWQILHQLLTSIIDPGDPTATSAAAASRRLARLAEFARLAAAWCEENGR